MPTATDFNINWSVFDPSEKEMMELAIERGHYDHMAAIIQQLSPEKVTEIEKIQRQMRPRSFVFDSQVQKEAEAWMSQNQQDVTPEIEKEWSDKIEAEKQDMLKRSIGDTVETTSQSLDGTMKTEVIASNDLRNLKGLGDTSIKRLNDANIYSIDEFKNLPYSEKVKLVGGLVASKFKPLTPIV